MNLEVLWSVLASLGVVGLLQAFAVKLIKNYVLKLFDDEADNFIKNKLDPILEKYLGDKTAEEVQKALAQYLRDRAKAFDEAAEVDTYPNKRDTRE